MFTLSSRTILPKKLLKMDLRLWWHTYKWPDNEFDTDNSWVSLLSEILMGNIHDGIFHNISLMKYSLMIHYMRLIMKLLPDKNASNGRKSRRQCTTYSLCIASKSLFKWVWTRPISSSILWTNVLKCLLMENTCNNRNSETQKKTLGNQYCFMGNIGGLHYTGVCVIWVLQWADNLTSVTAVRLPCSVE